MTKSIQNKPSKEQLDRRSRIIELAKSAIDSAEDTKQRARKSIDDAIECGLLLLKEKSTLKEQGIRGKWMDYFEVVFSKHIPYETARDWMRIAAQPKTIPIENRIRSGMLALELFPAKVHESNDEVKKGESLSFTTHLSVINKFVVWRMKFGERVAIGQLQPHEIDQLKTDFAPVIEFIVQLLDGSLPEAQKQKSA